MLWVADANLRGLLYPGVTVTRYGNTLPAGRSTRLQKLQSHLPQQSAKSVLLRGLILRLTHIAQMTVHLRASDFQFEAPAIQERLR